MNGNIQNNILQWKRLRDCKMRFDAVNKAVNWVKRSGNFALNGQRKTFSAAMFIDNEHNLEDALTPALIIGVLCQESSFGTSLDGLPAYKGAFQLSRAVITDFNNHHPSQTPVVFPADVDELRDLETSAKVAAWYIAHLLQRLTFKANLVKNVAEAKKFALAAYNGGPTIINSARRITAEADKAKWEKVKVNLERAGATAIKAEEIRGYVSNISKYESLSGSCWCDECQPNLVNETVTLTPALKVIINRFLDNGIQTLGELNIIQGTVIVHRSKTLELPWKNNRRNVSCIPTGTYNVVKRHSARFGDHFHLMDVRNRDLILIHHGNYYTDIEGCILVGNAHTDINNDGQLDVTNSRNEMGVLNRLLPNSFTLEIK